MSSAHSSWRRWRMGELDSARDPGPARPAAVDAEQRKAFQHQAELQALRNEAREEARREGHREGFEAGRQEGHAQGLEEGRRAGEHETARQRQEALAPLAALVDEFRLALADLDHAIAEDLVDLALATGRQLAGDALREEPAEILNLVRTLIHEEPALNGKTRLWLHPDDLALVEQELHAEFHAAGWKLHPDDQLSRGGCRVTSPSGELDATLESRW
ncbi:MAG: flagellar assembly protein FliH, partial [Alloalcanivorax venustensis]|uniref:flagellar assembly protein FliH n=1 Tax=Alloalcanivorax venustensis TaxID=172371 RepID=UPI0032990155